MSTQFDQGLDEQIIETVDYDFGFSRRSFMAVLGAGVLISVALPGQVRGQNRDRGGRGRGAAAPVPLGARLHLGEDGTITVLSGKVECGQGARAELTQSAAQELGVSADVVRLVLADTAITPDDGITAGSRTTPSTVPSVRKACAAARKLLLQSAAKTWDVDPANVELQKGVAVEKGGPRSFSYADWARSELAKDALSQVAGDDDIELSRIEPGDVMGSPLARPNARDIVTGTHLYPSDITRPGMLYGKVLRPPSFGATIESIDLELAKAMDGVVVTRADDFVAVAAPTTFQARQAIEALRANVRWKEANAQTTSENIFDHLRKHAEGGPPAQQPDSDLAKLGNVHRAQYNVAYVQHAPLEPRAAVAEWEGERLTVWTTTQHPFGVRRELAGAFHVPEENIRVIVPDFGGGFGGRHTGEYAVEAAKLAQAAKKPVCLRWTRAEEFTWASFRPAAAIDIEATVDDAGVFTSWRYVNINSGRSGVETPYRVNGPNESSHVESDSPLRHGSYRALASTANHFARESFIDEIARSLHIDPLRFRLDRLVDDRQRAVLELAAEKFGWSSRFVEAREKGHGIGLACGTDKGGFVAACAHVQVLATKEIKVLEIVQAFDCGAIINPANLKAQNEGAILMALGPALREESQLAKGRITNATFWRYEVPRMKDLPKIEVHLIDRPDVESAGAGETPIIATAPGIANAVFDATGQRLRQMPLRLLAGAQFR